MWAIKRVFAGLLIVAVMSAATPRLDSLPPPENAAPSLGLDALVHSAAPVDTIERGPQLLVFISLSVPAANLEQLFAQAERAQAVLVLRGLVNGSWRDTGAALQSWVRRYPVALRIDPQAFDRYGITAVPSLVLRRGPTSPCNGATCSAADQFVRSVGDVSLDYALAQMARSNPAFAADVATFRQRLTP